MATLLHRTPSQAPGESPMGFLLRASAENGYPTSWHLMTLLARKNSRLSRGFDFSGLAKRLGREAKSVTAYSTELADGRLVSGLENHVLAPKSLRLTKPQMCPLCVAELGYVPAWSDLAIVDACPFHQIKLLKSCPHCRKPLSWFRSGLLTCRCEKTLEASDCPPVSPEHAALLHVVVAKLSGIERHEIGACGAMPTEGLMALSLKEMLRLVNVFGDSAFAPMLSDAQTASTAAIAGHVLSHWPVRFYELLDSLSEDERRTRKIIGLRKLFESLFGAIFKRSEDPVKLGFIRQAFLDYGRDHSGITHLDPKLQREGCVVGEKRFQTLTDLANEMGVRRVTARRILRASAPATTPASPDSTQRYMVDTHALPVIKKAPGKTYRVRQAAARLELPVSVLEELRESGDFPIRFMASRMAAYHELDIENFENLVRSLPIHPDKATETMHFSSIVKMKLKSATAKADVVRAILGGSIPVISRQSDVPFDLLVCRNTALQVARGGRNIALGNTLSVQETAETLHCDIDIIEGLLASGRLKSAPGHASLRITAESVQAFSASYRSIAFMAKERRTLSRVLLRQLQADGREILFIPRKHSQSPQPFVAVKLSESAPVGADTTDL